MPLISTTDLALRIASAEGGQHDGLNPYAVGAGALAALLLLLWITTRLNRDR